MRVVILAKDVPNPLEPGRLGPDLRLDRRAATDVINPNDEPALEVALRLADGDPTVRTTVLSMGPPAAWSGLSKAVAAGIERCVLVSDPRLEDSCILSTARVLAAALAREPFDLVLCGETTADGGAGVVGAMVAALLAVPFIGQAHEIAVVDGEVRVRQDRGDAWAWVAADMPAVVSVAWTAASFRYPTLRSIMATRSRRPEVLGLADLGLGPGDAGRDASTTSVISAIEAPAARDVLTLSGATPGVAHALVDFLEERGFLP